MKIYTNTYDLAMPSANKFWVAPNSDFKIGIKVELRGQDYAGNFTLKQNGQTVTADEDKTAGFTTYTIKSGGPGSVIYTVDVPDAQQKFTLVQVVTDSTVFDVGVGGGDVPADVATKSWVESQISDFVEEDALTAYYTKSETSSATEIGTALEGKQPAGNYLTAETEPAFASMSADIVVDGDLTAYYTKSETSSAAEIAAAFAGSGGGGAISAYAVSESPIQSETLIRQALVDNTCLPQTIVLNNDNTIEIFDVEGELDLHQGPSTDSLIPNAVKVLVGTKVTSLANRCFMRATNCKDIVLPNSLSGINGQEVFSGINVQRLTFPDSLVNLGNGMIFWNYNNGKIVDFGNTRLTIPTGGDLRITNTNLKFIVPDSLYSEWITTGNWTTVSAQVLPYNQMPNAITGSSYTGTTGTPAAVNVVKSVYETDWETLSATADANTFYVVLPDPA